MQERERPSSHVLLFYLLRECGYIGARQGRKEGKEGIYFWPKQEGREEEREKRKQ
jgi:hypothetical protein